MISVAVDRGAEAARPWIEAAHPTHPSLVDTRHRLADLYNMFNVPTVVWIDERGRIVRPNDVAFGTDTFRHITGIEAARHLGALRWVRRDAEMPAERVPLSRCRIADQQARASSAWSVAPSRPVRAAVRPSDRGELAPPFRSGGDDAHSRIDPMGPRFGACCRSTAGASLPPAARVSDFRRGKESETWECSTADGTGDGAGRGSAGTMALVQEAQGS